MTLPKPKNDVENNEIASMGETWLNILVNPLLSSTKEFGNWKPRQRAFLSKDGKWEILDATEIRPFTCVTSEKETCKETFLKNSDLLNQGNWSIKIAGQKLHKFTNKDISDINLRTKLRFRRDPRSKFTFFICVKINEKRNALVKCKNRVCKSFSRIPYDFKNFRN